jgi:hypothetical protein
MYPARFELAGSNQLMKGPKDLRRRSHDPIIKDVGTRVTANPIVEGLNKDLNLLV